MLVLDLDDNADCKRFLAALFADAPTDAFVEIRVCAEHGMRCTYSGAGRIDVVASTIAKHASRTDVYVGVLPRQHHGGTRDDVVDEGSVLWVDCDSRQSVRALADFAPRPSMTIASGTGNNRHAYWLLRDAVPLDMIEGANRRLAHMLGADIRCTDAARILRPPSSLNHKHPTPTTVHLVDCDTSRRWYLDEIVDDAYCDVVQAPRLLRAEERDALLRIDPARYVERLAGAAVARDRKAKCPFHDDRTPSLHAYHDPKRGWYCFGCGRGGSIYDFAALLWGYDTRGADFIRLRDELTTTLIV